MNDNDTWQWMDWGDWDWDAIDAAALALCEAAGVGVEWQNQFSALPTAEQRRVWNALTDNQRSALVNYWMDEPNFDRKEKQ